MRTVYALVVPLLAVFTALVLGAAIIALTGGDVGRAYQGLWEGSLGTPRSISDTLVRATPYVFGGLAVALAFKGGLVNIGVEGQITVGSLATAFVGYAVSAVPFPFHLILAVAAGIPAGAAWGAIPGFLKAATGAHEVIVTIMLNYVAINVASFLLGGPMKDKNPAVAIAQTPPILASARLPTLLPDPQYRVHWGVVVGVVAAIGVWWLLTKTTVGFTGCGFPKRLRRRPPARFSSAQAGAKPRRDAQRGDAGARGQCAADSAVAADRLLDGRRDRPAGADGRAVRSGGDDLHLDR